MDLERVAAVIRPRSPWEAVDLGYTLVRAWWRSLFPAWIACFLPLWALAMALGRPAPAWALLALGWAKPLADRLPLFVASRALFGAAPALRETLAAMPRLLARGLLPALTVERLDPARSFRLPIRQLEGLAGGERRDRAAVLRRDGGDIAVLLTLACLAMEVMLFFALLALGNLLLPDAVEVRWSEHLRGYFQGEAPLAFHWFVGLAWFVAWTLVEPFYAVAGFALYLNRRTLLEGWDVEIAFRRLARRLLAERGAEPPERGPRPPRLILAGALLGAALGLGGLDAAEARPAAEAPSEAGAGTAAAVSPPQADTPEAAPSPEDLAVEALIAEILAAPEFGSRRTATRLRWRQMDRGAGDDGDDDDGSGYALPVGLLGRIVEVAMWLSVSALVAVGAVYLLRRAHVLRGRADAPRRTPAGPAVLFGLDLAPDTLPADVPGEALRSLGAGRAVEALSLLFRGALAFLVRERGLEVRPSWTEGECLSRLAGRLPADAGEYLGRLTRAWQAAAYAHRRPDPDEVEGLCRFWRHHFEAAP